MSIFVYEIIWKYIHNIFFNIYLFIYLAALGLSCGTQAL